MYNILYLGFAEKKGEVLNHKSDRRFVVSESQRRPLLARHRQNDDDFGIDFGDVPPWALPAAGCMILFVALLIVSLLLALQATGN